VLKFNPHCEALKVKLNPTICLEIESLGCDYGGAPMVESLWFYKKRDRKIQTDGQTQIPQTPCLLPYDALAAWRLHQQKAYHFGVLNLI
jgi:hypothetical protein